MTRRELLGRAAAIAAMGLTMLLGFAIGRLRGETRARRAPASPAREIADRLRERFDGLDLDDAVLSAFSRDYLREYGPPGDASWQRDDPYQKFLLSTDFFQTGADASRPPRYVRLYDAYRSPCYQPLARFGDGAS